MKKIFFFKIFLNRWYSLFQALQNSSQSGKNSVVETICKKLPYKNTLFLKNR